jgi:3-keto-disaccharide hydrolase
MNNLFLLSPVLLAILLQAPKVEPGFTSLFNGKDFTGWKLETPESWTIEDGAIKANGQAGHAFYDGEFRNHSFHNFELKVDIMTRPNSNGGVYVLTEFQDKGFPKKGFEIQVNNSYVKDRVKTGSLYHVQDVLDDSPAKDNEWFTEHIIVKDNTITVKVNDKETVTWTQPADWNGGGEGPGRSITAPGTIALQAHDPNSTVYYKNIRIKPLD